MTPAQKDAILCLSRPGPLTDPKYHAKQNQARAEATLKAQVKECWSHRKDFPKWVQDYVAQWASAKSNDTAGVGSDEARGV